MSQEKILSALRKYKTLTTQALCDIANVSRTSIQKGLRSLFKQRLVYFRTKKILSPTGLIKRRYYFLRERSSIANDKPKEKRNIPIKEEAHN